MPELIFDGVSKSFGETIIIDRFTTTVRDGEFLVLLGPSGCGKSTLLRLIAGLSPISSGELRFDGEVVNDWEPRRRGVAFVFQTYALYPHMTVRANIAFPLIMNAFRKWYHLPIVNSIARRRLMRNPDIAARTESIARQLELDGLLDRRPASLSGGQRQRVALARALVRNPSLYLLDEPLSNLDAKLRTQMRSEIAALHQKVGKTFIYVTHDQVEAMTMADRIIILNKGVVQQVDTPDGIYNDPANTFVARFVGSPPMNLFAVTNDGGQLSVSDTVSWSHDGDVPKPGRLLFGIRPEKLTFHQNRSGRMPAQVALIEKLGSDTIVGCRFLSDKSDSEVGLIENNLVFAKVAGGLHVKLNERCSLDYASTDVLWFDELTEKRIPVGD